MKKTIFISFLLIASFLIFFNRVAAQIPAKTVDLYFFNGNGCPHCAQAEIGLADLAKRYPQLQIKSFEVYYNQDNRQLYFAMAQAYGLNKSSLAVPIILIGSQSLVGYNETIKEQIENEIIKCSNQVCPSPADKILQKKSSNISSGTMLQSIIGWIIILLIAIVLVLIIKKFIKRKK